MLLKNLQNKLISNTANISAKAKIGKKCRIWHNVQIRENVKIGNNCIISKDVYLDKNVKIGNNTKIQNASQIYDGVKIGNNVFIGPGVVFTNDKFPRANNKNWKIAKTIVSDGVSIGANSTIICGIKIDKNAMIGAGSVVTKNIKKNSLYFGNPAKFIKKI